MKKRNSILKAMAIVAFCLAQGVWAQVWNGTIDTEWYWDNTSQMKFTITTAEQLAGLAQLVNGGNSFSGKTIKLGSNIMLNDTANWKNWTERNSKNRNIWTAIGTYTNENNNGPFSGTFDGDGYIVSGVYISNSNNYQGLFGYTGSGAIIKNVGVTASSITGRSFVGGLVGFNNNGIITDCTVTGQVNGSSNVGGLIGSNKGAITNCHNTGNVTGGSSVGGLIGSNYSVITNSYATGDVKSSSEGVFASSIGGLVGINESGIITDCYATGKVTGGKSVGGLIGSNSSIIKNCYATGNVASSGFGFGGLIGGLVGENRGSITNCNSTGHVTGNGGQGDNIGGLVGSNYGSIENCNSTGHVIGGIAVGGLVGFNGGEKIASNVKITGGGIIANCYATGKIDGSSYVGGLVGRDNGNKTIENCYATGNVTGSDNYVGGLMGSNGSTIMNCNATGNVNGSGNIGGLVGMNDGKTITNCYAIGKVSGTTSNSVGGLVGMNDKGIIKSSYYDRQTSEQVDINKGEPKSTAQMKQQATFVNWNFNKIWRVNADNNNGYPYLQFSEGKTETAKYTRKIQEGIVLTDKRDNKKYKTVIMGTQTWMAENLNYNEGGSKCYDNDESNCQKYGRLYNWSTAMKACPNGWHLPSRDEWRKLVDFAGGGEIARRDLKAASGWNNNGNGTDEFGFSALPSGSGISSGIKEAFRGVGRGGHWWSASRLGSNSAYHRCLDCIFGMDGSSRGIEFEFFSVRCLQD
jgi:uncharacterized protein (TIGR02145 family)